MCGTEQKQLIYDDDTMHYVTHSVEHDRMIIEI